MGAALRVGDTVTLASGGPPMTVVAVTARHVGCAWFDARDKQYSDFFPPEALKRVDGTDGERG